MARRASTLVLVTIAASCLAVQGRPCHQIPANRVWDVQWSGNPSAKTEHPSGFDTPYKPPTGQIQVDSADYFTLAREANDKYQLRQFSGNGTLKSTFPQGEVKANSEVVFYIIDGWFGTAITQNAHHKGDSAKFLDLVTKPSQLVVEKALGSSCLAQAQESSIAAAQSIDMNVAAAPSKGADQLCNQIQANRVWDVQWSGRPSATTESASSFYTPYNPSTGRVHVDPADYFTLTRKSHGKYQLRQFSGTGTLKSLFPEGEVKANSEVVFYIIDGWFGTVITQDTHHEGDSAKFTDLVTEPSPSVVEKALGSPCLTKASEFLV